KKFCASFYTARADLILHPIVGDDVNSLDLALVNLQTGRHLRISNQIMHTRSAKRQRNSQEALNQHTETKKGDVVLIATTVSGFHAG
ncbi:hypothetical protein ACC734_38495, partial [Rhizobium ruizarguesonis]